MLVDEGDDGDNVLLLDHGQGLGAVDQDTVEHIQHLAEKEKKKGTVVKQHDEEEKNAMVSAETMIHACQVPWLVQKPVR